MEKQKQKFCKSRLFSLLLSLGLTLFFLSCSSNSISAGSSSTESKIDIESPKEIAQGQVFFVTVKAENVLEKVTARFLDKNITFFPAGTNKFKAFLGIDPKKEPGSTELLVNVCINQQNCVEKKIKIEIKSWDFPSETLRVPPRTIEPNKKDQARIAKEVALLNQVYSQSLSEVLWAGPVQMPIDSEVTSIFGTRRLYNGKVQNAHYGTDLRAAVGTSVLVPFRGKVVLAKNLFFTGNTVILDHGYGFFSVYGHMSSMKVKTGQVVEAGKVMGLSGATGRVSGPHLHWGVHLHGSKVDPIGVLKLLKSETHL